MQSVLRLGLGCFHTLKAAFSLFLHVIYQMSVSVRSSLQSMDAMDLMYLQNLPEQT